MRYRDKVVGKFLNILMEGGKKSTAERICYGAFDVIQEKTGETRSKCFGRRSTTSNLLSK